MYVVPCLDDRFWVNRLRSHELWSPVPIPCSIGTTPTTWCSSTAPRWQSHSHQPTSQDRPDISATAVPETVAAIRPVIAARQIRESRLRPLADVTPVTNRVTR